MHEKDMEELMALYPAEFFPQQGFTLVDRQGSLPDVGHYDLLFRDHRGTNNLLELEARPAKSADAEQLAKRKDALDSLREDRAVLWLVATNIQPSIREHLEKANIEHMEIPVADFYGIAEKYDYPITPPQSISDDKKQQTSTTPKAARTAPASAGHTRSVVKEGFRKNLSELRDSFETGHRFLSELAEDQYPDFRLGTYKNAHLYYSPNMDNMNDFYAYIVLDKYALVLIPKPNGHKWEEARDKSEELLFGPPLDGLIRELDGFNPRDGWASHEPLRGKIGIVLTNRTPGEFFDRLLDKIREVQR